MIDARAISSFSDELQKIAVTRRWIRQRVLSAKLPKDPAEAARRLYKFRLKSRVTGEFRRPMAKKQIAAMRAAEKRYATDVGPSLYKQHGATTRSEKAAITQLATSGLLKTTS